MTPNYDHNHTPQPADYTVFIGFMLGVLICMVLTMCTSCSRKVTQHAETADSTMIVHNASTTLHTEGYLNVSTESLTDIIEKAERTWTATTTRTYYSAPDSLGNQYVTSKEESTYQGGSTTNTHTTQKDTTQTTNSHTINKAQIESGQTTTTHHQTTDKQVTTLPWYYQYALYLCITFLSLLIFYFIYRYIRTTSKV